MYRKKNMISSVVKIFEVRSIFDELHKDRF